MQVSKWGNSLALRLPAALVKNLGLKEGDEIEVVAADRQQMEIARPPSREELLARIEKFRGLLPADFNFNRDEANGADRLGVNEPD